MDTPPVRWAAALMAEIQIMCCRRFMGSSRHPVRPDRYHSVFVPLRPSEAAGSRLVRSQKVDTRTPDGGKPI